MDMGHLGDGAYGTVSKMLFPPTDTVMAVKVCVCVCVCVWRGEGGVQCLRMGV